jgi:hypothetical protein
MNQCCGTCRRTLLAEDFDADKRRPNGLSTRCKDCRRAVGRAYMRRKREAGSPLGRRWRVVGDAAIVRALLSDACGGWIAAHTPPWRLGA